MYRITTHAPRLAHERVTVRHTRPADAEAIARLAALDSGRTPTGPMLVAESDARILAALPLGSGRPIADPFTPTTELVALLKLRANQLREGEARAGRGLRARLRRRLRVSPETA
jgi:hypothetical protein